MEPSARRIEEFRTMILTWWDTHKRDLPWRHTRDPYRILVSEVMLQQTQVSRVLPKYAAFLEKFPTVESLARAPVADVLREWKGLGYNRRALYLHRTAGMVTYTYSGVFPESERELTVLPGMGTYTARAIMVFAFEQDVAMVDTNIRKIITHYFLNGQPQKDSVIQRIADSLVPIAHSWAWHQALMDYGALVMPSLVPKEKRRKGTPFIHTDRYARGKIMDLLREHPYETDTLLSIIASDLGRNEDVGRRLLAGLEKDGLIQSTGKTIGLP